MLPPLSPDALFSRTALPLSLASRSRNRNGRGNVVASLEVS
ncbi:hypothetical protein LINPERHAP1_LOCUS32617 [Linum perenne]